jgi:hypothetical protein
MTRSSLWAVRVGLVGLNLPYLAVIVCLTPLRIRAQGQVNFATKVQGSGVDVRFRDLSGKDLASPPYLAGLQIKESGQFHLIPGSVTPFRAGAAAGYVTPMTVTFPFPDYDIGDDVSLRVVTFNGSSEADFASATQFCFSNVVMVNLGGGTHPPPDLVGLNSYSCVPEPSTILLLFFAAPILLNIRRECSTDLGFTQSGSRVFRAVSRLERVFTFTNSFNNASIGTNSSLPGEDKAREEKENNESSPLSYLCLGIERVSSLCPRTGEL